MLERNYINWRFALGSGKHTGHVYYRGRERSEASSVV